MSEVIAISEATFESEVLKADIPVLVDFWAPWCAPCLALSPIIEEIAKDFSHKIRVAKINVDENPIISQKYGIRGIPTLIFFSKGKVEEILVGFQPKEKIVEVLSRLI
ncbi:MAG: thioredoxin [Candidatus Aminicenantes bacterium]|nr:thioredoxin [Candidatus Aminicenantes bacterium]